jgi:hypothetical protein
VREVFQDSHEPTRLFDLRSALGTIADMGLQGCYPEAHLVIEEEVDLVWKQVPIH